MQDLNSIIVRPTLLLDETKCLANINAMASKARNANIRLRPHFKTHQSTVIGNWFKEKGVEAIAVSSMAMAKYFADNGWKDITVAIPVNVREIEEINALASKIQLNLVVESRESILYLKSQLANPVGVFIKVDTGYQRCGIPSEATGSIRMLVELVKESKKMQCKGFLAHTGHNYKAKNHEEIHKNHLNTLLSLSELKYMFWKDIPDIEASLGDTPACSISEKFYGVDEIRPGNFVFYDVMQYALGTCNQNQIAVAMACPIIARNIDRKELVVHGGAIHFSKEHLIADDGKTKWFGSIVRITENGWSEILDGAFLADLSQEHGIIRCNDKLFEEFNIGGLIGILPVHSCLTANLMGKFLTTNGDWIETVRLSQDAGWLRVT